MPCDYTHHLKQEWSITMFLSDENLDDLLEDVEDLMKETTKTVAHSQRIRSSKLGTANIQDGQKKRAVN